MGISEDACTNAGGKWFRSSCDTLKEAIDDRPSKFDLENPITGTCQDAQGGLNVAYVKASTSHADFTFTSDEIGCNEFCRSLPNYADQVSMMVERTVRVEPQHMILPNLEHPKFLTY